MAELLNLEIGIFNIAQECCATSPSPKGRSGPSVFCRASSLAFLASLGLLSLFLFCDSIPHRFLGIRGA